MGWFAAMARPNVQPGPPGSHCPNLSALAHVVSATEPMSESGSDVYRDLFREPPLRLPHDRARRTHSETPLRRGRGLPPINYRPTPPSVFEHGGPLLLRNAHRAPAADARVPQRVRTEFQNGGRRAVAGVANAAERRDADGRGSVQALVVIKATDRRRYERQLVDSRSELPKGLANERETAELREQFIAVGHDLRNPLAAVSAAPRILQRSGALQNQNELRVLDMINSTVTRMSDLIENPWTSRVGGWEAALRFPMMHSARSSDMPLMIYETDIHL